MLQLVESIQIIQGKIPLLSLHNDRCNRSVKEIYGLESKINLADHIHLGPYLSKGEFKCRVIYDKKIREISYQPYHRKSINSVKLVNAKAVNYSHKYLDRKPLDLLYHQRKLADEIIIVNDGKISDAYYYNLCFWDGLHWYTPSDNLLDGVMRSHLLSSGSIKEKSLSVSDLSSFIKVSFINALNHLGQVELDMDQVI